jgi:hypothetical protein
VCQFSVQGHIHVSASVSLRQNQKSPGWWATSRGFSSPVAAWVFCRAAFLVIRSMKILWAAPALAKIKAITKPPEKHSSDCSRRLGAESLQNIQLTGRVCRLHAFQYIPTVFTLATRMPEFFHHRHQGWEQSMVYFVRRYPLQLALAFLLGLISSQVLAQAESRTYQLNNRPGDDVAVQIRELYQGSPVTVTARGQQLVVRGEPPLLEEIGRLVETLDVAPVQVRITVRSRTDSGGKRSGAGISASNGQAGISAERRVTSTGSAQERSVIMQDGQSAHITSGQVRTIPVAVRGGRNPAAFLQQVETRSGFLVSPQVISDQAVELSIVSFEEEPANLDGYETEAVVTIRRVEPGQWVTLGSTATRSTQERSGITYQVNSSRSENRSFEVRVDVLP